MCLLFWLFVVCIVTLVVFVISIIQNIFASEVTFIMQMIFSILAALAMIPIAVRRLHDINLSGYLILLHIIPWILIFFKYMQIANIISFILTIVFLILYLIPGTKGVNKYGDVCKY